MAAFRGTLTHELRGAVDLEARQEADGHWVCVARIGAKRFEERTYGELWGLTLQQVCQQALDTSPIEASPPRSLLVKRAAPPPTPPRRRPIRSIASNPSPDDAA
jgi:hypothetical protein